MSLPDVDFANIRPYGQPASRADAFEELSSVLIEQGAVEWPAGVRFERFGNPDGGRDGQGVLPDGDVWAWQVKYLFKFDASAVKQITDSVRRALGVERRLKRYYVVLPIDLSSGDTAPGTQGGGSRCRRSLNSRATCDRLTGLLGRAHRTGLEACCAGSCTSIWKMSPDVRALRQNGPYLWYIS